MWKTSSFISKLPYGVAVVFKLVLTHALFLDSFKSPPFRDMKYPIIFIMNPSNWFLADSVNSFRTRKVANTAILHVGLQWLNKELNHQRLHFWYIRDSVSTPWTWPFWYDVLCMRLSLHPSVLFSPILAKNEWNHLLFPVPFFHLIYSGEKLTCIQIYGMKV